MHKLNPSRKVMKHGPYISQGEHSDAKIFTNYKTRYHYIQISYKNRTQKTEITNKRSILPLGILMLKNEDELVYEYKTQYYCIQIYLKNKPHKTENANKNSILCLVILSLKKEDELDSICI